MLYFFPFDISLQTVHLCSNTQYSQKPNSHPFHKPVDWYSLSLLAVLGGMSYPTTALDMV